LLKKSAFDSNLRGTDPAGAKALLIWLVLLARLKLCPATKRLGFGFFNKLLDLSAFVLS
jgi:hypothetical protein